MHDRQHATVVVEGHEIAYSTIGSGRPLLLVPGNSMSSERWIETGYVAALADSFRLILIDPLGHGRSEKVTDRAAYRRDHLTAHLLGVLDDLGFGQVAAWGYSRGAQMLADAAVCDPNRFSHTVLGGIPLFDVPAVLAEMGLAREEAEYDEAFTRSAAGDWEAFWSVFPVPIPDDAKRMMEERNDLAAITAATWAARSDAFVFEPSTVPTMAYWGDGEIFHGLNVDTAAGLGDAVRTLVVSGGHAEAFAGVDAALAGIRPFLDGGGPE